MERPPSAGQSKSGQRAMPSPSDTASLPAAAPHWSILLLWRAIPACIAILLLVFLLIQLSQPAWYRALFGKDTPSSEMRGAQPDHMPTGVSIGDQ